MSFWPIWWACEMGREFKLRGNTNVVVDVEETTKKGFSVEKIEEFLKAIQTLAKIQITEGWEGI